MQYARLNVTLLMSENEYLQPGCPLVGEIEIHEVGTNSEIIKASFRCELRDGRLGAPVEVKHPVFRYGSPPAYPLGREDVPPFMVRKSERGKNLWTDVERWHNRCAQDAARRRG